MTVSSQVLNLFYVLSILINSVAHGVNIQAYRQEDFEGLLWESRSTAICNNTPRENRTVVNSIRTDTCFIAYNRHDCKSPWSEKFMANVQKTTYIRWIESFRICSDEEGGTQLDVDLTENYKEFSSDPPAVLESYKNVCTCVNVPIYVQNMAKWSINNHHNDIEAYYEPNCSENKWNSKRIAAGHNPSLTNMELHKNTDSRTGTTYKIQSFGPNTNSSYFKTSCNPIPVATPTATTFRSTTEREPATNFDFNVTEIEVLTNQIVELQTLIELLKQNLELKMKQQLDTFTERIAEVQNECGRNSQFLSDKFQNLENVHEKLENKTETQREEFLEIVARLQASMQDNF